jgi:hypothetical protein
MNNYTPGSPLNGTKKETTMKDYKGILSAVIVLVFARLNGYIRTYRSR